MKRSKPNLAAESAATLGVADVGSTALSEDLIRARAYALYEARNGENGSAQDDWMQAQSALCDELGLRVFS